MCARRIRLVLFSHTHTLICLIIHKRCESRRSKLSRVILVVHLLPINVTCCSWQQDIFISISLACRLLLNNWVYILLYHDATDNLAQLYKFSFDACNMHHPTPQFFYYNTTLLRTIRAAMLHDILQYLAMTARSFAWPLLRCHLHTIICQLL